MRSFPPPSVGAGAAWLVAAALCLRAYATEGPELTWLAPDECPGPDVLRGSVERSLGRSWAELESRLSIDARLERVEERWRLELLVRRDGEALPPRRVDGESCEALVEAGAAIVALVIERELAPEQSSEPPADEPRRTSAPAPPPAAPTPRAAPEPPTDEDDDFATPPRAERGLRGTAELAGLADVGLLPRASLGGRLGAGIRGRAWAVSLAGVGLLPVRGSLGLPEGDKYGRFWLAGAQVRGCGLLGRGAVQLASCGVVEGASFQGSTHGVTNEGRGGVPVWSLGPELGLRLGGGVHRLEVGVGAQFPLVRHNLVVENALSNDTIGEPVRPGAASVRVLVGYRLDP